MSDYKSNKTIQSNNIPIEIPDISTNAVNNNTQDAEEEAKEIQCPNTLGESTSFSFNLYELRREVGREHLSNPQLEPFQEVLSPASAHNNKRKRSCGIYSKKKRVKYSTAQPTSQPTTQSTSETNLHWILLSAYARPVENGEIFVRPDQGQTSIYLDFYKMHATLKMPPINTNRRKGGSLSYIGQKWSIIVYHHGDKDIFPGLLYQCENSERHLVSENIPSQHLSDHAFAAKESGFKVGKSFGFEERSPPIIGIYYSKFTVSPTIADAYLKNSTLYFAFFRKSNENIIEQVTHEFSVKIINSAKGIKKQFERTEQETQAYEMKGNLSKIYEENIMKEDGSRRELSFFQSIENDAQWGTKSRTKKKKDDSLKIQKVELDVHDETQREYKTRRDLSVQPESTSDVEHGIENVVIRQNMPDSSEAPVQYPCLSEQLSYCINLPISDEENATPPSRSEFSPPFFHFDVLNTWMLP